MKSFSGIILAGGKSSRMGTDKGLVTFKGQPLVSYPIDLLKSYCDDVIIIAGNAGYEEFGLPVFPDQIEGKGPVSGIASGLIHTQHHHAIVLSCDCPFMTGEVIEHLIKSSEEFDVVIPTIGGKLHPLSGMYTKSCTSHFTACVNKDELKLREAIKGLNHSIIEMDDTKAFINLNDKEALKAWE